MGASGREVRAASRHGHCFTAARIDATFLQPDRQTLTSALPGVREEHLAERESGGLRVRMPLWAWTAPPFPELVPNNPVE